MKKTLQTNEHLGSPYNRPNLPWLCGHHGEGKGCPLGPSQKGKCRGGSECIPVRKGDRWTCTRSSFFGGECPEGPGSDGQCCRPLPPCQPLRSQRAWRKRVTGITFLATTGLILVLLGGSERARQTLLNPGDLTSAHAPLSENCSACHQEGNLSLATILKGGLGEDHGLLMSENCLKCHPGIQGKDGSSATFAHGLKPSQLKKGEKAAASSRNQADLIMAWASSAPVVEAGETGNLACSTCHQEHHGIDSKLNELSNRQCQVCHSQQFSSLSDGHPDIRSFNTGRRSTIYFDHATHYGAHFGAKGDEWAAMQSGRQSCRACHEVDAAGQNMLTPTFEQGCAGCHGEATGRGNLDVLALPAMNAKVVGGWPMTLVNPPKLSPLFEWLLAGEERFQATKAQFDAIPDPRRSLGEEEAEVSVSLKEQLVEVLQELGREGGHDYFDSRALPAGLPPRTARDVNATLGAVPPAVFAALLRDLSEAEEKAKAKPESSPAAARPPSSPPVAPSPGGNLLATPPPTGGSLPSVPSPSTPASPAGGSLLSVPTTPKPAPPAGGGLLTVPPASPSGGGLLSLPPSSAPAPPTGGSLLSVPATTPPPAGPGEAEPEEAERSGLELDSRALRSWNSQASWSYAALRIQYRPQGHADPFLVAWLESAARTASASEASESVQAAALKMLNTAEVGSCLMCHTVDRAGDGQVTINWKSRLVAPDDIGLTDFMHAKHIDSHNIIGLGRENLEATESCQTCHAMVPKEEGESYGDQFAWDRGLKSPVVGDPHGKASNFASISLRKICADCHTTQRAGDRCLTCHQYHSHGPFPWSLGEESIAAFPASGSGGSDPQSNN